MLLEEGVCYDQGVLLAKLCYPLLCFILYSKAKLACYSTYLFTSYFYIPVYLCVSILPEKAMAPHSNTFAWKIPWMEGPGGLQSMGSLESDMTERLHFHFSLSCIGEGNGNPLQCSCLENPRDGGAWWAAVYGVVQSRHD